LNELLKKGVDSVSGDTHRALALGAYQLLYLDKIPAYAAVNDSVNLVKEGEPHLAGVANRVLKLIERDGAPDLSSLRPDDRLAAELSHPVWWVRRQQSMRGLAATRALAEAHNRPAPLSIRFTPQRDQGDAQSMLQEEGAKLTELKWASEGFQLDLEHPFNHPSHRQGTWYVQDEASQLVTLLLNPEPGARVWDICAAPGGKSLTLLSLIGPEGSLLSTDLHERKTAALKSRLAGFSQADVQVHDALQGMPEDQMDPFDAVLLDAPCSALGVIRRHPEIRWRRTLKDIKRAAKRQLKLLETAALALKVGGILVYSVCTDTSEETDEVVSSFLKAFPDFALAPPPNSHPWNTLMDQGTLRLNAADHNTDGFYAVRFTRLR
jgi:16S rRNA (cytosine967-C5)-methyltransferase